jgi:hypothetical protein
MSNETLNIATQLMLGIRISNDRGVVHNVSDGGCHNEGEEDAKTGAEDSQGFGRKTMKELGSTENRDSCVDQIQERMIERAKLLNSKVVFQLVIAEPDLNGQDCLPSVM